MIWFQHVVTPRLRLDRPTDADLDDLHALYSDAAVWRHAPHARHTDRERTASMLAAWQAEWADAGLGQWVVRPVDGGELWGNAGCALRGGDTWWNLAYRFSPAVQGHGYAVEAAQAALEAAHVMGPEYPVVASLLEHNEPSKRLAERLGLTEQYRGTDAATAHLGGVRLLFADRPLTGDVVASVLGH